MTVLRATRLGQQYGGVTALDDVSLELSPGELVGIVGPNGSGKTTLVDVLTGLLSPQRGSLELDGTDVSGWNAAALARAGVARTFQTARLMEPLSVLDNVLLGLHTSAIRGGRRRTERAREAMAEVGIAELSAQPASRLSHGQRRRVELARALVGRPRALVLDEPTAGLFGPDAEAVAQLLACVAAAGVAMAMIEHDLGVVAAVCSRVVVMDRGAVVDQGPAGPVLAGDAVAAISGGLGRDRLTAVPA